MALRKWGQTTPQVVGRDGWGDHGCGGHGRGSFGGSHSGHTLGCWWSRPAGSFFPPTPHSPPAPWPALGCAVVFPPNEPLFQGKVESDPRLPGNRVTECVMVLLERVGAALWGNWSWKDGWSFINKDGWRSMAA